MKPAAFEYLSPTSIEEAVQALTDPDDGDTKVLAGGQSLVPLLSLRLAQPARIVDINRIPGLGEITESGGVLTIGTLVRQRSAEHSDVVRRACPLMAEALPHIGHTAIRNRGTVGGSIAHADPAAELPTVAACLDAELVARGPRGERVIPAAEFFTGFFTTALAEDEILTAVRIRSAAPGTGAAYEEVSRRHGDFAMAGVAAVVRLDGDVVAEARIAISGVDLVPVRAGKAEAALVGRVVDEPTLVAAAEAGVADLHPSADLHGSAPYRKHLAGVLIRKAVRTAAQRARESR
ncbi:MULTISPECIES: xanthine dehydrogenase family protein subunit M [unclassified Pseudonocardia]|jgi:carbon-monoxide dehydrogenase medium subunit|uniref:FAD binding domain-containing protein n=1 Tax=unclassified Pseudonocardia TaxID=2619320 RepID=UPI000962AD20|nr:MULTISPECIES: xanthine dehydrogenase family protein subunit M [unclassified Pseudonocardia]MBN9098673.1 xanthine dehydrogenase family protein subunit M [Pseudonocardia sp.]OJY52006.1 MAG: molybdopterin dehydrogenase [Pseudonocardia sp. 73-21]